MACRITSDTTFGAYTGGTAEALRRDRSNRLKERLIDVGGLDKRHGNRYPFFPELNPESTRQRFEYVFRPHSSRLEGGWRGKTARYPR